MERNADEAARLRNEARGAMVAERAARREAMSVVSEGRGRLARRVSSVLLDTQIFEDWVEEKGGAEEFMRWFCAQVAAGVTARILCDHYMQDEGLLGGFLAEKPERMEQYYRAQEWAAQGLVDEAYEEAWDDGPDVVRSKLRVATNMQIAGKFHRARFGEEKQVGAPGVPVINFVMGDSVLALVPTTGQPPEKLVGSSSDLAVAVYPPEDDGGL